MKNIHKKKTAVGDLKEGGERGFLYKRFVRKLYKPYAKITFTITYLVKHWCIS